GGPKGRMRGSADIGNIDRILAAHSPLASRRRLWIASRNHSRRPAMSFELWAAFALASAIVVMIPGPTVLLVISYALGHGRRPALAIVAGVALGDFTAMTASILGVGALLAASATLFTALKWIGAAYLVYLGVKLWRAPVIEPAASGTATQALDTRRAFFHAYVVTALNPKSIVFFVAFLPQFLDPAGNVALQLVAFEIDRKSVV